MFDCKYGRTLLLTIAECTDSLLLLIRVISFELFKEKIMKVRERGGREIDRER